MCNLGRVLFYNKHKRIIDTNFKEFKIPLGVFQVLIKAVSIVTILHRSKYQFVFSPLDWEFEMHWWEGDVRSGLGLVKGLGDSNTMPGVRMVMVPFIDISLSLWNSFLCGLLHYNLHHSQIAFMMVADATLVV